MKQRNAKITKLFVLASATACFALAGCSSDNGNVAETEIAEAETDEEAETAEETVEATEEPTPEPTATPTPEPEPETWFEEQGLSVTPQGEFKLQTQWNYWGGPDYQESASKKPGDEVTITVNSTVTETTDGVEDGYKKVVAEFEYDWSKFFFSYEPILSYDPGLGSVKPSVWISAFDRYTGTSFEPGDVDVPFEYEGTTYDANCTFEWGEDYDYDEGRLINTCTVTVVCPVDYDGTVFDIGCGTKYSPELGVNDDEPYTSIDYSTPVKVDVFPFFTDTAHPHFYFSSSDE